MRDRWITIFGALGALILLVALLYPPGQSMQVPPPTSEEPGNNGYLGLKRWLEQSGVPTAALRRRMSGLHNNERFGRQGNILVTTLPYIKPLQSQEAEDLRDWVEAGNTLLVMAALNETPFWTFTAPAWDLAEDLQALTGLSFDTLVNDEGEVVVIGGPFEPVRTDYSPAFEHPLMAGGVRLQGLSDTTSNLWHPNLAGTPEFIVRLAQLEEHGVDILWQIPRGDGQLIVSASGTLFNNRMLGEASNAQFFANVMAWHLGARGTVLFDDYHQGLSDLYDPEAFFSDSRLHNSIWFVLGFWFLYLVGTSSRLAPVREAMPRPSEVELVRATGGFMSRKLHRSEAGLSMVRTWLRDIRRHRLEYADTVHPPWDELEAMPLIDTAALTRVRDIYSRLGRGEKIDLRELHNNLLILKRNLA
jgi:hypothetical protein